MSKKLYHFEDPIQIFRELIKVAQSNPGDLLSAIELVMPNVGEYDRGALMALTTAFEDNDQKAMSIHSKAQKLMNKSINEIHIHKLMHYPEHYAVAVNNAGTGYVIQEIQTGLVYEYFPKSNRLHSRKLNKWFNNGHKSIIQMINKHSKHD